MSKYNLGITTTGTFLVCLRRPVSVTKHDVSYCADHQQPKGRNDSQRDFLFAANFDPSHTHVSFMAWGLLRSRGMISSKPLCSEGKELARFWKELSGHGTSRDRAGRRRKIKKSLERSIREMRHRAGDAITSSVTW